MQKALFIVNPYAGQRKAKRFLMEMLEILNHAGFTVIVHTTAGIGDGVQAVLRYANEIDRVICCGGDGTFNEAVSGVLQSGRDIPIGYIPAGSTNDFASSLHLSSDLLEATRAAAGETTQLLDVGCFGGRYFSYIASFGAFTKTSYTTPQSLKNLLGHAAYVLSGIQELSQLKATPLRFELADGTVIEDEFLFGAVSNSTSVGGVLTLDEERVNLSDGVFELLLLRLPKDLWELADCARALQQKTYDCAMLSFCSTSAVTVIAPSDMPWTIDGEHESGHERVEIKCVHRAIRFVKSE